MPLHPQAQEVIDATRALGLPPANTVTPAEARANAAQRPRAPGPEVGKVQDRSVPGPASDVPVRIYTPEGDGPFPILVWYHGGGWVVGNLDSADGTARHLCAGSRCVVVSVDYRLSPEAKFPEPFDDCYYAHPLGQRPRRGIGRRARRRGGGRRQRRRQPGGGGEHQGRRDRRFPRQPAAPGLSGHRRQVRHRLVYRQRDRIQPGPGGNDLVLGPVPR